MELTILANFCQIHQSEISSAGWTNFSQIRQSELSLADLADLTNFRHRGYFNHFWTYLKVIFYITNFPEKSMEKKHKPNKKQHTLQHFSVRWEDTVCHFLSFKAILETKLLDRQKED